MLTIKELREERGWSQSELAEKLNVSLRTVQNYEADQSKIPLNKLNKIYKILNSNLADNLIMEDVAPYNSKDDNLKEINFLKEKNKFLEEQVSFYKEKIQQLETEKLDLKKENTRMLSVQNVSKH